MDGDALVPATLEFGSPSLCHSEERETWSREASPKESWRANGKPMTSHSRPPYVAPQASSVPMQGPLCRGLGSPAPSPLWRGESVNLGGTEVGGWGRGASHEDHTPRDKANGRRLPTWGTMILSLGRGHNAAGTRESGRKD